MKKYTALLFFSLFCFSAQAFTQAWVYKEQAVILLGGAAIERDAINFYDSLNAPVQEQFVDGMKVASKQITFVNFDGSLLLDAICMISRDGTDLGQCFITINMNRMIGSALTIFDITQQQLHFSVSGETAAQNLARLFTSMSPRGSVFQSSDGRFSIYAEFGLTGALQKFTIQYL